MRGFSDPTLWVAETTNEKVVAFGGRRFSWAIPFEIIYLSPLKKWNPYKVKVTSHKGGERKGNGCRREKDTSTKSLKKCAYTHIHKNAYYMTPKALWSPGSAACCAFQLLAILRRGCAR